MKEKQKTHNRLIIKCNTCPDSEAEFIPLTEKGNRGKGYIKCKNCNKEGRTYGSKYAAVLAWNREVVLTEQQTITLTDLVERITYQCNERKWDYAKLSSKSGVPLTTLLNIIHGNTKNPGIFTIMRFCDAFQITLDELMRSPSKGRK